MRARGMARLARAFIMAGGRVLICPKGLPEPAIDADLIFGPRVPDEVMEYRRALARTMLDALRRPAGAAYAKRFARFAGMPFNGWFILPPEDRP
jgi:hypothetical protein